jgi:hypothetical protein
MSKDKKAVMRLVQQYQWDSGREADEAGVIADKIIALLRTPDASREEVEALKKRLADEQESHNRTLAGWYDLAQFGALKARAEKLEKENAELRAKILE